MRTKIAGVILAGGAGSRIGGAKGLQPFAGATLIEAVIASAFSQVSALAINVAETTRPSYRARFADRFPLIADSFPPGTGPLAGIVAGLEWAASLGDIEWLASFPCDTPFLPVDLVSRLLSESATGHAVAAEDASGLHGVCAVWRISCVALLRRGVENGTLRSLASALDALGGTRCRFEEPNAFFNVNTPKELKQAEAMAKTRR